jgi:pilus assembly protein CpaC
VRLNFTPVIHGDRVHLKVRPEVSTLDFANGVLLQGFRIPALSTRRTETEVDLLDGQTFAIAGLMNNTVNSTMQKIPGIGDIPIIGNLFKSKAAQKDQTELVVMITPQILQRKSAGVTSTLPGTPESFLEPTPAKKLVEPLPEAFTPQRSGVAGTGAMKPSAGMPGSAAPVSAPAPAAAPTSSSASTSAPSAEATQKVDNTQPASAGAPPLSAKEQKKLDEANRKKAQAEQEAQDKAAREQAKRDAEAAKVAAEQAKRQARIDAEAAKTAAERAKHQADAEKKQK